MASYRNKHLDLLKSPVVLPPSKEEVKQISEELGLKCTPEEIEFFHERYRGVAKSYQKINEMVEPQLPVRYPRTPGHRETEDSAWYWRCDIKGADTGKLAGKTIAIKDNIAVAGVPMMNGNKQLEGYTPEFDATIITRILDEGGRIIGKAVCEDLCFSGSSWTSSTGPVPNPHDATRSAGGSSSGSASLVARGEVDMAIGGDQGGSIRIPSSWCGIVGHKPTFGLVPYTGAIPVETTIDHLGPITRSVKDCALFLEVLAGYDDGRDPRQHPNIEVPRYSTLLTNSLSGKRVGILKEGFENVDEGVASCVREAAETLRNARAAVEEVSVPLHTDASAVFSPIFREGGYSMLFKGYGSGYNWKGHYCTSMQEALAKGFKLRPFDFPVHGKMSFIFSEYISRHYQNKFYAKAQNLNQLLAQAYDDVMKTYDVLVMPTLPCTANKLPTADLTLKEAFRLTSNMFKNTSVFNATGHPALTINAGTLNELPVGMMIVGRHFDDLTVLQVAYAFEQMRDQMD